MKVLYLPLLLGLALSGQDKPEAAGEKPDPVKKARELLDGAAEMAGGAQPQIQVAALWHIGDNYQALDRKKALAFFKQAFAACPTLPAEQIPMFQKRLQVEIVGDVANLDPDTAAEMVKQIGSDKTDSLYDLRRLAIFRVTAAYVAKSQLDKAIELVEAMGGSGVYSFESATMIFKALSADDPRRQAVFGSALAAFDLHPNEGFKTLLAAHWKDVPPTLASAALRSFLNYVLDRKPDADSNNGAGARMSVQGRGTATAKGAVVFSTPEESNLFDVMWIVREIEPKRAEEILQKYPELKANLETYPKGMQSLSAEGPSYGFVVTGESKTATSQRMVQQIRMQALIANQKLAALQTAAKDPEKALDLVRTLPNPSEQVELLTAVVRNIGEKDPGKARNILNRCMAALAEVKDPGERIQSWDVIAEGADLIKDEKLTREAIDRGLADAAELYKQDEGDAKEGVRLQEYWPSTTAYRRIIMRATKIFQTDAEPIVVKIADPNLNLLARIAMAQSLLGRQPKVWQVYQSRRRPQK